MTLPPHSASAEDLYYEGLNLLADDDPAAAAAALRRAIELDPGMLDAMHGLIRALGETGDLDEAIAVARRLSELDPADVLAHTSLSILYQRKGMIAEAEAESARARVMGWKKQLKAEDSAAGQPGPKQS